MSFQSKNASSAFSGAILCAILGTVSFGIVMSTSVVFALSNQTTGPGARPPEPAHATSPSEASVDERAPASVGPAMAPANIYPAVAVLVPAKGSKVTGTVQLVPEGDKVKVVAKLEGLTPNSKHGFHIHQFGDCSDPAFKTAGDHFNPTGQPHGAPGAPKHHIGDLGNLTADANGKVNYEIVSQSLTTSEGSVLGRSVVVHKNPDDLKTQPSGDSGDRIACGVIGIAKR